jgi:hypothetical protein
MRFGMGNKSLIEIEPKLQHSKWGIISVAIGALNIIIIIGFAILLSLWLTVNQEILKNPASVDSMKIPEFAIYMISIFFFMQLTGSITGILGFFERGKSKLMVILGVVLNGIFLLITSYYLYL